MKNNQFALKTQIEFDGDSVSQPQVLTLTVISHEACSMQKTETEKRNHDEANQIKVIACAWCVSSMRSIHLK